MRTDTPTTKVTPIRAPRFLSSPANPSSAEAQFWASQMAAVAAARDMDCFMRIYDHFAPRLQRYLLGRGAPAAQAEELVQEAMLRLWRRAESFDPARASLGTWLFRVARNLHLDSLRGEPLWLPMDEAYERLQADGQQPETESTVDYAGLQQAIESLPAMQARLIRMSYFEAKSHGDIARELSMPLGSVKSALRRAFARLQAGLGGQP
jgi:RNA polymerase sigma-70 factor (ECF subfamily)